MVRVGLIGCGTIGSRLALALQQRYAHAARISALHDSNPAHASALQRRLHAHPPLSTLPELIRKSDVVVESASSEIASHVVSAALRAHRSVLVMSVGGLLTHRGWRRAVGRSRGRVYVPSGALAGLDGIKALAVGRIRRVSLTTSKPPRALASAPYVVRKKLRLTGLRRAVTIFEGSATAAVKAFPQNTNVAAALTLASGVSGEQARIRVVADPALRRNRHEVDVEGDCGRVRCQIESEPSRNPKTSELAVRSAIATLQRLFDPILIGT